MDKLDTENRNKWYNYAEIWEKEFIEKYGERLELILNPSKEINKTAPDLYSLSNYRSADLKVMNIPFYKSQGIFGIPPQHCWTFNYSDLCEYAIKYSDSFGIFIWKRFQKDTQFGVEIQEEEAVYVTNLYTLKRVITNSGKLHHYIRRVNDNNGNSYASYGVDLRELIKLI